MNIFTSPHYDKHEQVVFGYDEASGLKAIVAVHNTNLGPSLGGCRMHPYGSDTEALADVLRLSKGMTYKSALADLPLGGGKSVIIGDPARDKNDDVLEAMGRFVDSLGGNYIAAKDMGMCVQDLTVMARRCQHISGIRESMDDAGRVRDGDPSPSTAYGMFCGIKASVKHRLDRNDLEGIKVAIQGLGSVGYRLAGLLREEGAELYVSDVSEDSLNRAARNFQARIVPVESILALDVDVISPCALGAVINDDTVDKIQAKIVAGAANNQLATPAHGERLHRRGILYAPDYVINAGGIIDAYYMDTRKSAQALKTHVENIANTLDVIYQTSSRSRVPTNVIADQMAEARFQEERRLAS